MYSTPAPIPAPASPAQAAPDALFEQIASGIESSGYAVLPAALPESVANALLQYQAELDENAFHRARIGRGRDQLRNELVRRDQIHWIEEGNVQCETWLAWTRHLRQYLNRRLFLGLFSFESHLSRYEKGAFYRRHVDAFKGEANRVLSLVAYLNRGWEVDHGGQLVIYHGEENRELLRVLPAFGTVVVFLSEEFPHEVLTATRERHAVAGWYRLNSSGVETIDPPA